MFFEAFSFNQPIDNWNTSNVTDMSHMFYRDESFNQPINVWNTSKISDISFMFACAESFNQPLDYWDTSSVTDISYILKVLALVASKFKNTNGTDYANSWLRSRYNQ